MNPIIKWPGGKSREIEQFIRIIPKFDRYIEPFFGGGAVFFCLKPQKAVINDISSSLITFYQMVKNQDQQMLGYLKAIDESLDELLIRAEQSSDRLLILYECFKKSAVCTIQKDIKESKECEAWAKENAEELVRNLAEDLPGLDVILPDRENWIAFLQDNLLEKMLRTWKNEKKIQFSTEDLADNLKTGLMSGYYMYFREIYNQIYLGKRKSSDAYFAAVFFYIREYCYGSMFRCNRSGKFNIPYGGISYNSKKLRSKITKIYNGEVKELFENTELYCMDFEKLFSGLTLTEHDFIFLDPPYDTEFSDYDGRSFKKEDQKRLADFLSRTQAKFVLVIKNTEYIYQLYESHFSILMFDKKYIYNVKRRNSRSTEHLIITNIEI